MGDKEKMLRALACSSKAFERIRTRLRPGMTEMDFYRIVEGSYLASCGYRPDFAGDFLTGPRCGGIEGGPTKRVIEEGDTLIADLLVNIDGICCDITRTFFFGKPSPEQRRAYDAVRYALLVGEQSLLPGIRAHEVFTAVEKALIVKGYSGLAHHAGHGIGRTWYQAPYLEPGREAVLEENCFLALEPGVYVPGDFGIRLENNYILTAQGAVCLSKDPLDIDAYIIE